MTNPSSISHLKKVLDGLSIQWVLIGALAANRYRGSPRLTNDIDLLLADTGTGIDQLEDALVFSGWTVFRADPHGELLRLKHVEHGIADLLIAGTDYQKRAIDRAVAETVKGESIKVLTVEDVIIHKLIAGRFQDLADIEAILKTGLDFDHVYVDYWIEYWDLLERWNKFQEKK